MMSIWLPKRTVWSGCSMEHWCSEQLRVPNSSKFNCMLRNYFKIAIAVLRRRKFFTFISLFGISFTLTILVVLTAFIDKVVGDNYPDKKRDRSLYISRMEEVGKGNMSSGQLSFYFLDHFTKGL